MARRRSCFLDMGVCSSTNLVLVVALGEAFRDHSSIVGCALRLVCAESSMLALAVSVRLLFHSRPLRAATEMVPRKLHRWVRCGRCLRHIVWGRWCVAAGPVVGAM